MNTALVCGAGGFIGGHLVRKLKREGFNVRGVDRTLPEFAESEADDFVLGDLRDSIFCKDVIAQPFDEVYQLAAEIGGAEFTYVGVNNLNILVSSAQINLNVLQVAASAAAFVACSFLHPLAFTRNAINSIASSQTVPRLLHIRPSRTASMVGKSCFRERLFAALGRSSNIATRIARYHNIFGPEGKWKGGREKAPAALCRKIATARDGDTIDIIGDGEQSRSFLHVAECLEGTLRLMRSTVSEPINIGSEELVTINQLTDLIMDIAGKQLIKNHIAGPVGVRGRNSNNRMIKQQLGWAPSASLRDGLSEPMNGSNSKSGLRPDANGGFWRPQCDKAAARRGRLSFDPGRALVQRTAGVRERGTKSEMANLNTRTEIRRKGHGAGHSCKTQARSSCPSFLNMKQASLRKILQAPSIK